MALRALLLFLAALALGSALLLYNQEKPSSDIVFSTDAHLISLSATAMSFSAPKGKKRIEVMSENGAKRFTDCLAIPFVCADAAGVKHPIDIRAYELSSNVIWPISVTMYGRTVVTAEDSRRMYELYLKQERDMVLRLGLTLAAVSIFYSIKIGMRQTPSSSSA